MLFSECDVDQWEPFCSWTCLIQPGLITQSSSLPKTQISSLPNDIFTPWRTEWVHAGICSCLAFNTNYTDKLRLNCLSCHCHCILYRSNLPMNVTSLWQWTFSLPHTETQFLFLTLKVAVRTFQLKQSLKSFFFFFFFYLAETERCDRYYMPAL